MGLRKLCSYGACCWQDRIEFQWISNREREMGVFFLTGRQNWNKSSRAPCVGLMWRAEVDQYVAEEQCIQKMSGPVIPLRLNGCDACGVEQIIINPGRHLRTTAVLTLALRWGEVKPKSRVSQYSKHTFTVRAKRLLWPKTALALCCGQRDGRGGEGVGSKPAYMAGLSLSRTLRTTLSFCASFQTLCRRRGMLFIKQTHQPRSAVCQPTCYQRVDQHMHLKQ